MATYAIGDVQGCYDSLQGLLQLIGFDPMQDVLWFCGDLVNRGPHSLEVLRFIRSLKDRAITVLGNHDLHLLAVYEGAVPLKKKDTFFDVLNAADGDELCHWLAAQRLFYWDKSLKHALVHAGVPPIWSLAQTEAYASEVSQMLQSSQRLAYLKQMYGDVPACWDASLQAIPRWRLITNYLTRMRICDAEACLELNYKSGVDKLPPGYKAWFLYPNAGRSEATLLFGHWAALNGEVSESSVVALDTGCAWGGKLTAYCIETGVKTVIQSLEFPPKTSSLIEWGRKE